MKPKLILTAALLAGCENPVTHLTDPEKREVRIRHHCIRDTTQFPEVLPPGYQDSIRCR